MSPGPRWFNRLKQRLRGEELDVWYHPAFRLPLPSLEPRTGLDPRRADLAAWVLIERGAVATKDLHRPWKASWSAIGRVHDAAWLDRLMEPETLARIFAVDVAEVGVNEVLDTVRLAVGATVEAAQHVRRHGGRALNLMGGFHHATRALGAGYCPVNDVAIAIAELRLGGFQGEILVLDLDAHPPDGLADCLQDDPKVAIASLSGVDWGPLPGRVDETVLPSGTGDTGYLAALEATLGRCARPALAFVLAGADTRAEDTMSELALSEAGLMERDRLVLDFLGDLPSVWLPAGGYGDRAWRVLAHTGLLLAGQPAVALREDMDPQRDHFAQLSQELRHEDLGGEALLTEDDLVGMMGYRRRAPTRFLGFYTPHGSELALERFGILEHLRRLGYGEFEVELGAGSTGDRLRVWGQAQEQRCLLIEVVAEESTLAGEPVLFIHWLTLRHPLAAFRAGKPALPGQEVPGLGMLRDAVLLLHRVSERLERHGLSVRPAWVHVAYAGRHAFRFIDGARQGRFEALLRDLGSLPLAELSRAVADGKVLLNGGPYAWEADTQVSWSDGREPSAEWDAARLEALAASSFALESR